MWKLYHTLEQPVAQRKIEKGNQNILEYILRQTNENTTYQKWDATEAVLKGKLTTLYTYIVKKKCLKQTT